MARESSMRILALFTALALFAHAPRSEAITTLQITVLGGAGASPAGGDGQNFFETVFSSGGSLYDGDSARSPDGSSLATGNLGFGWVRSLATANHSAANEGVTRTSSSSAQSLFREDLTITAPGASGGGSVTFLIEISGGLSAGTSGETLGHNASADWNVFADSSTLPGGGRIAEGSIFANSGGNLVTGDPMGGVYEWGPIPFSFGFPFEILIALNTESDVNFCCSAAANFGSTLTWEGVVEIRDGGGALVPEFSIGSGSGVDFAVPIPVPVPEPPVGALPLAPLLAIPYWLRKKRSTP